MPVLFVSDLHLDVQRPETIELFLRFLRDERTTTAQLYILGDLFEVWLGDDAVSPGHEAVLTELRNTTASGVPVFLMHGNRDFLIGAGFAEATGCRLIDDPTLIELYGTPTLLMHGDMLCTDDVQYQAFRARMRAPAMRERLLSLPVEGRAALADEYRAISRQHTQTKPMEIMDVNPAAVLTTMRRHGVTQLIHGHTHRPAIHRLTLDGRPAQRIVLGDWGTRGSVLRCTSGDCRLETV